MNYAGVEQPACTLCGDCCSGCNVGAKNTVQVTYLADAFHHGAEIFTEMKVTHVRQERGRWRVFFEPLGHEREKFAAADQSITADVVVLAGGTLGSTEILLRSRAEGLALSDQLGERFHRQRRRPRLRLQQRRTRQRHRRRRAAGRRYGAGRAVHQRSHRFARYREARGRNGDRGGLDPIGAGADPAGAVHGRGRQVRR
ncbi:MAG: GMC family oxidoreductase N-terminal domain-containing protein [Hyphomicrobium sp.]